MEKKGLNYVQMNAINWPKEYLPGTTDNFCSNEVITKGITSKEVWHYLTDASLWPTYYSNSGDIKMYNQEKSILNKNTKFHFSTFGFPIEAKIIEFIPPENGKEGRIAWHGWAEGDAEKRLDVVHAWLVEDLEGGRCRILTQESQKGKPAVQLHNSHPNTMINGHQDWLDGIVKVCLQNKEKK